MINRKPLSPAVLNAAVWIQEQMEHNSFAEIGIKLVLHDSKINRVEKLVVEKTKPTESGVAYERKQ